MPKDYVIITGACSEIGFEICCLLQDQYNFILIDFDEDKLKLLKNKLNTNSLLFVYDLRNIHNLRDSLHSCLKNNNIYNIYGFIHIAGIAPVMPIKTSSIDLWNETMYINFLSAVEIIKVLLLKSYKKYFKSSVFISSICAHFGIKAQAVYSVSKASIESFVKSAAVELSPIRFNAIAPGRVITSGSTSMVYDNMLDKKFIEAHLLGAGNSRYIADILKFLLLDSASWITGQTITIDGGVSINLSGMVGL